jgi:hypothetical protein
MDEREIVLEVSADHKFSDVEMAVKGQLGIDPSERLLFFHGQRSIDPDSLVGGIRYRPGSAVTFRVAPSRPHRPRRPLPPRDDLPSGADPPDFPAKVDALRQIGPFTRAQCEDALRRAFFNLDTASLYLVGERGPDAGEARAGDGAPAWDALTPETRHAIVEIAQRAGKPDQVAMALQLWYATEGDPQRTLELLVSEPN